MSLQTDVIIFVLFAQLSMVVGEEILTCPSMCTCHDTLLSELPISAISKSPSIEVDESLNVKIDSSGKNKNEVLDEMDDNNHHLENNPQLKMAVCVLQSHMNIKQTFEQLRSIEVLTILQNPDTENVTFKTEDFSVFQRLVVLEIHGFDSQKFHHNQKPPSRMKLRHDVLRQLKSLQYINLEFVELLGSPAQGSKVLPVSSLQYKYGGNQKFESNDISVILQPQFDQRVNNRQKINKKPIVQHLVFLEPNQTEEYILPYKVYKEEQEKLGLYSFSELDKLKFLRVFHCNLREVYWDMFEGLRSLETLIIEGNDLLFLPDFAFYGTPNLRFLSLAHNKLLSLQSMNLAGLLQLKHIDVSHNNITHLSELSLPPFPKLHSADFRENPLEIIFPSTFEIMNATQELYLGSKNTVVDIQPNSFFGLKSLTKLLVSNINLEILERDYLKGMPKLKELKLEGHIKQLAFDAFLEVPKIERLILKNCSIEKISMDSFYGLYNLLSLDLSYNPLNLLPPGVFDQLFSLKELNLHGNNLTELPVGIFSNIPAKMIRLDGNPWHCTCAMKDWQPSIVNRVRQVKQDNKVCQFRFDKGSTCPLESTTVYLYDKTVGPRCSTPAKYEGWSVFHLLRKELRCHKNKKTKIDRRAYLEQKLMDYEKMKQNHLKSPKSTSSNHESNSIDFDKETSTVKLSYQVAVESETPSLDAGKIGEQSNDLLSIERVANNSNTEPTITQEKKLLVTSGDKSNGIDQNIVEFHEETRNILVPKSEISEVIDKQNKDNSNFTLGKEFGGEIRNQTLNDGSNEEKLNKKMKLSYQKPNENNNKKIMIKDPDNIKIKSFDEIDREQKMNKYKQKMRVQLSTAQKDVEKSFDSDKMKEIKLFKEMKKALQKDLEARHKEKLKFLKSENPNGSTA